MAEGVQFRDIPLLVCAYLRKPLLAGIAIVGKIPQARPDEFIRILRTGGVKETLRSEAAQITVEAWAQTEARAFELLNNARALINAADGTLFGAIELGGPANLPDPSSAQIRCTMSFQIRARGTAVTV